MWGFFSFIDANLSMIQSISIYILIYLMKLFSFFYF